MLQEVLNNKILLIRVFIRFVVGIRMVFGALILVISKLLLGVNQQLANFWTVSHWIFYLFVEDFY